MSTAHEQPRPDGRLYASPDRPTRPLRVALMTRVTLAHSAGGMESHAESLRHALAAAGHQITTFTTTLPGGPVIGEDAWGVTRYLAGGAPGAYSRAWDAALLSDFLAAHEREPFDVVASQSAAAFPYLAARSRLAARQQAPVVLMNHGSVAATFPQHLREFWRRPARTLLRRAPQDTRALWNDRRRYPLADHITALSSADKAAMVRWLGVAPERITVIPNGVDTRAFRPDAGARSATRTRLGLEEGEIAVAVLGRLERQKGQELLLDALAALVARDPRLNARLVLIGIGPARERLVQRAAQLGITARVMFLGAAPHAEIPALLNAMDIVGLPSLVEAMPLALLEAMACGRAVIASRVGAIGSIIEDGVNGLLVRPAAPQALTHALHDLVRDPEYTARLGARARETVARDHDEAVAMARYEEVFKQVAKRVVEREA